jgi:hypothetical protein
MATSVNVLHCSPRQKDSRSVLRDLNPLMLVFLSHRGLCRKSATIHNTKGINDRRIPKECHYPQYQRDQR